MKVEYKDNVYYLNGALNDFVDFSQFSPTLTGKVVFDFQDVTLINSMGIKKWIEWLIRQNILPQYLNVPPTFVTQLNMLKELLVPGVHVLSVQVPVRCHTCRKEWNAIYRAGIEYIPGQKIPDPLPTPPCATPTCQVECEVEADFYFAFVEHLQP